MDDKRQQALDRVTAMVMRGEPLSEADVEHNLRLARDQINARILQKILANSYSQKHMSDERQRRELKILELETTLFNKLQNAVERHESINGKSGSGSIEINWNMPDIGKWDEEQEKKHVNRPE